MSGASIGAALRGWLAHPLTRHLALDDPRTTVLRRRILAQNIFLRRLYEDWYRALATAVPGTELPVLEVGTGGGFLRELAIIPGLITSDALSVPGVDCVLDARSLPFRANALRGIVMTDALHHVAEPRRFFAEAARCLAPGGVVSMIEPWVTPWSRFVYGSFHHEPFVPDSARWEFPAEGPLSGANGALPWILFARDKSTFAREFPQFEPAVVTPIMPLRYLLSGGVSLRALSPAASYPVWRRLEGWLEPVMDHVAMFAQITLRRRGPRASGHTP